MKKVLSIQDLSCLGKCSMTVTLPVLSAMGCACSVLPTAVLSTHTGFPKPYVRNLTEDILPICRHWQENDVRFDAISVGYLSDPAQVAAVETVLDSFQSLTVIDPVLGDHGKLYCGLGEDHIAAMVRLCRRGDVLLPNVTEAALLTGIPYRETSDRGDYTALLDKLMEFGAEAVVITGVSLEPGTVGFMGMDKSGGEFSFQSARVPKESHGTGDLFAAVFTGALLRGEDVSKAARRAADFVTQVLSGSGEVSAFGLEFETQLPRLWEQ